MTSPLYGLTGESVILDGTIKLVVILGEAPRMMTTVIDFLMVNCPSAYNRVLGISLLRALKAATSVHCLTMKFLTIAGIGQVRGRQWDSRECYNKLLELAKKKKRIT